ncbi:MAG TPA: MFS transporter [Bryobacteraceae bacterium]|nr:MFS transporter [Bryobacteraceae bacterium]
MGPTTNTITGPSRVWQGSRYYGWPNLAVAALAMVGTLPGRTQGLGLITEPLIATLGMSRVTYAELNLWATLIGAAFCLPCGRLTDRFGSRHVLTSVAAALGLTVIAMSQITGVAALAIAITLTRGLGQSALSVVSLALVGKWFSRRINQAMGIYSLLVGIGFILAFPTVGQLTLAYGWRVAWLGVGLVLTVVIAPVAWLIVRNGPEEVGSAVDGVAEQTPQTAAALTFAQAMRSAAFWVFAIASSLFGLVYSGIALFNQSILEQRGFDAAMYHTALVISTLVGLAANFAGGWAGTRWPIQRLMGIGMAVLALSLLMLPFVKTAAHVTAYAVTMGVAGGVVTVVFFSVWSQVFGRQHLGRIQGCAQMMTVFASACGPLLLAETYQRTGSYESVFFALAAVVAFFGIACWIVRLPTRTAVAAQL